MNPINQIDPVLKIAILVLLFLPTVNKSQRIQIYEKMITKRPTAYMLNWQSFD